MKDSWACSIHAVAKRIRWLFDPRSMDGVAIHGPRFTRGPEPANTSMCLSSGAWSGFRETGWIIGGKTTSPCGLAPVRPGGVWTPTWFGRLEVSALAAHLPTDPARAEIAFGFFAQHQNHSIGDPRSSFPGNRLGQLWCRALRQEKQATTYWGAEPTS
jgi:hypothetical protein